MLAFSERARVQAIQAARELQQLLREYALNAEVQRKLPVETVASLSTAGQFRMAAPQRLGGLCVSTAGIVEAVAVLAEACASSAWVVCVSNSNSWLASLAPPAAVNEIFREGVPIICGATAPTGTSQVTPNGRTITGKWGYLSGSNHAKWASLTLADRRPDGTPLGASAYVPMSSVTLEETWYVAGLRGTGSNTGVLDAVSLPDHLYVRESEFVSAPRDVEPTDFIAMVPQFRVFLLAVMVGAAEAMVKEVVARAKKRGITYSTYRVQAQSQAAQRDLGEAAAMVYGAREILLASARQIDAVALAQRPMTPEERAHSRGQTALANQMVTRAAENLMYLSGASGFAEDSPLQRYWRDISVAARHGISVPALGFELAGRALLGVEGSITPSSELV